MERKTPKQKKCRICKELYTPKTPLQIVDKPDCAYRYGFNNMRVRILKHRMDAKAHKSI